MSGERLQGDQGYLYFSTFGSEISGDATGVELTEERFYKIVSKGAVSGLPTAMAVKDVIYNKPHYTLKEGDVVKPITISKVAFVTNIPASGSKSKNENTTQIDPAKNFAEGRRAELSGSIEGYFLDYDESGLQEELLSRFKQVTKDDGAGTITVKRSDLSPLHFFMSRYETTEVGKQEVFDYMPLITDSITMDKPLEGNQPFNFNYTIAGSERPTTYFRTVTA